MRILETFYRRYIFFTLTILTIFISPAAYFLSLSYFTSSAQNLNLRIVGPDLKPNPVVNQGGNITVAVLNGQDQVRDVRFESGSPDIVTVDSTTGQLTGIKRGFATITARRNSGESVSAFVVVARVLNNAGPRVPGDTKTDTGNSIYISDPLGHVIMKKAGLNRPAEVFAGRTGESGKLDGVNRKDALFSGPTAVAIDNRAEGGIYVTDTLNHSIRKISFDDEVSTILGTGMPGVPALDNNDQISFTNPTDISFNGPRGIATDLGGNLYVADTDNHALYFIDLVNNRVKLLAGMPGLSGKADGKARTARFLRPTGIAVSADGRTIAVVDSGNKRIRLITARDGNVTTLGSSQPTRIPSKSFPSINELVTNEVPFDNPQSVSFDATGNLYVVDSSGPVVVTDALDDNPQIVALAQPGTFGAAVSVVVDSTDVFVLDLKPKGEGDALKVVSVGEPTIDNLNINADRMEGGAELIITGKNFAPESTVILGDRVVEDAIIESATRIRLRVPPQDAPGTRTLSVQTRGGVAQKPFVIMAKTLSELANGAITTVAGGIPFLGDGGMATQASLEEPFDVVLDSAGNLYILDSINNRIRRVDTSGVITTIAGNGRIGFTGDGGPATSASLRLGFRDGMAIDGFGNIFVVDTGNARVRRIDAQTGIITTVVGSGLLDFFGDDGPATQAGITPADVAVDKDGNLFVIDIDHNRIRKVDTRGIITTVAGSEDGNGFSGDGGPATKARLAAPHNVIVDDEGNLFIADSGNNRIRKVDTQGIITTVAGDGFLGESGEGRFTGDGGLATNASLNFPLAIALDADGNLFISDTLNLRIRRVDAQTGIINTVVGNGSFDFTGDGGPATEASIVEPHGITIDGNGDLFLTDFVNDRIRKVDAQTQIISTVVGIGDNTFRGDNDLAVLAGISIPRGVALDRSDNLYIADEGNNRVRRVRKLDQKILTVAGSGTFDFKGDNGPAIEASLANPIRTVVDKTRNLLYIADRDNQAIRRVNLVTGIIVTVAGGNERGFSGDGGPANLAQLDSPTGVAVDTQGNLFIADAVNNRIRRVDAQTGIITTVAGSGPAGGFGSGGFSGDGGSAEKALLNVPSDIAIDPNGNIFILDSLNFRIRRVDAKTGIINTVAGGGDKLEDGVPATETSLALFSSGGIAVDAAGDLYYSDQANNRIRRVNIQTGIVTTVVGQFGAGYSGDGGPALAANLSLPDGLAIDSAGNLYISDTDNNVIRVAKGVAKGQDNPPDLTIINATFRKSSLLITGSGFGTTGAIVKVNDKDISSRISNQADSAITLKGNKKKLNLKNGRNEVTVTVNGIISNIHVFNLLTASR
ncbi:MAG: SMP-30/gluconolactonase/LRE family protein [Acidobacteriota bacterium]